MRLTPEAPQEKKTTIKRKPAAVPRPKSTKYARMDVKNRALAYLMRNPPVGCKKMPFKDIVAHVFKTDGRRPTVQGVKGVVYSFHEDTDKVGRKKGWRKTTKKEDAAILKKFHQLRPPGHGIDSRELRNALSMKLKAKVGRKTVIRRLADKGYKAETKIEKSDPGPALAKRRCEFAEEHKDKTAAEWKMELQAVGDFTYFTYYPLQLRPKFKKVRAKWTYMMKGEKTKSAFVRPKRWFPKKDYKLTKKQCVFGMVTSNGKSLAFLVPKPLTTEIWAGLFKKHVVPFLKKALPRRSNFQILLDGEQLLHGPAAKAAMVLHGISVLPNWPKYSPDLNPQENVWRWAENHLRKSEKDDDTFEDFGELCLRAVAAYTGASNLVGSMQRRMAEVLAKDGAMIAY